MDITTWSEAYEAYDEMLNEVHGAVNLGELTFEPARIIRELDPIAYRCGVNDWADGQDIDTDDLTGDQDRH